ncbi:hypothetical protein ABZ615_03800 [Streptomyces sp. NPDC007325]|uniref:hypothetical protein n=1 Tax=Streptomyces sp. NPDC007325 TaxID=3154588 RepID=UPI0033F73999
MTRTAHHLSLRRHDTWDTPGGGPWRTVVLHDLRYSARALTDARRAGRRPRPTPVRRHVAVYATPRFQHDDLTFETNLLERRARQALRARLTAARRLADAPGPRPGPLDPDAAGTVDIPPARHRRSALWLS